MSTAISVGSVVLVRTMLLAWIKRSLFRKTSKSVSARRPSNASLNAKIVLTRCIVWMLSQLRSLLIRICVPSLKLSTLSVARGTRVSWIVPRLKRTWTTTTNTAGKTLMVCVPSSKLSTQSVATNTRVNWIAPLLKKTSTTTTNIARTTLMLETAIPVFWSFLLQEDARSGSAAKTQPVLSRQAVILAQRRPPSFAEFLKKTSWMMIQICVVVPTMPTVFPALKVFRLMNSAVNTLKNSSLAANTQLLQVRSLLKSKTTLALRTVKKHQTKCTAWSAWAPTGLKFSKELLTQCGGFTTTPTVA